MAQSGSDPAGPQRVQGSVFPAVKAVINNRVAYSDIYSDNSFARDILLLKCW